MSITADELLKFMDQDNGIYLPIVFFKELPEQYWEPILDKVTHVYIHTLLSNDNDSNLISKFDFKLSINDKTNEIQFERVDQSEQIDSFSIDATNAANATNSTNAINETNATNVTNATNKTNATNCRVLHLLRFVHSASIHKQNWEFWETQTLGKIFSVAKKLVFISLSRNNLHWDKDILKSFAESLQSAPLLRALDFGETFLSHDCWQQSHLMILGDALSSLEHLTEISFKHNHMSIWSKDKFVSFGYLLLKIKNLKYLSLEDNGIVEWHIDKIKIFGRILNKLYSLKALNLLKMTTDTKGHCFNNFVETGRFDALIEEMGRNRSIINVFLDDHYFSWTPELLNGVDIYNNPRYIPLLGFINRNIMNQLVRYNFLLGLNPISGKNSSIFKVLKSNRLYSNDVVKRILAFAGYDILPCYKIKALNLPALPFNDKNPRISKYKYNSMDFKGLYDMKIDNVTLSNVLNLIDVLSGVWKHPSKQEAESMFATNYISCDLFFLKRGNGDTLDIISPKMEVDVSAGIGESNNSRSSRNSNSSSSSSNSNEKNNKRNAETEILKLNVRNPKRAKL